MSLEKVRQEIEATEFYPTELVDDGKLRRFKRTPEEKSADAWIVIHRFNLRDGGVGWVAVWNDWHLNGEPFKYSTLTTTNAEDRAHVDHQFKEAQKKAAKEQEKEREICRGEAAEYLPTLGHDLTPYAQKKGLSALFGAYSDGDRLVVPVINGEVLHGYQTIEADGTKRFKLHTAKKGNYFLIGGVGNTIFITEGFATGASVHMATGSTVVIAFDAGNVQEVWKRFPDAILAGDNDDAGRSCGKGFFPPNEGEDWNDVAVASGLEAVKKALEAEPEEWFRSLGYRDDTYFYTSSSNQQVIPLSAASHTENNFLSMQPRSYWESRFPGKTGPDYKSATSHLMAEARRNGIFNPKHIRGTGAWFDGGLVINCGDQVFPRKPKSGYIYIVSGYVPPPTQTTTTASTLTDIIEALSWKHSNHGKLLIGWLAIAPFCGALGWRPHIWLTGQAGAGKSVVLDKIVAPVLGHYKVYVKGNSTEAGIRQTLAHDAKPLVFDEFEQFGDRTAERNKAVMDLCRQASFESGGEIVKGSSSGNSLQYSARFCAFVASILVTLDNQADKERFSLIELNDPSKHDKDAYRKVEKQFALLTPEYSQALFSFMYHNWTRFNEYSESLWDVLNKAHTPRFAQQYAPLVAGYAMFKGISAEEAASQFNFEDIKPDVEDSDEHRCLNHLTSYIVNAETPAGIKHERAVREMIKSVAGEGTDNQAEAALLNIGLKMSGDKSWLCIANTHPGLNKIFGNTKWYGNNWSKSLSRLPDSEKRSINFHGKIMHGIKVHISNIFTEDGDAE